MKKKVSYIALIICTLAVALFWDNDIARTLLSFELLLVPCLFILSVYLELQSECVFSGAGQICAKGREV